MKQIYVSLMLNMQMMVISVVVTVLGMVPKDLRREMEELEIRGGIEIIQSTLLLKMERILRKVLETQIQ